MKKIITLILVLALVASLGVMACAAEDPTDRAEAADALWGLAGRPVVNYAPSFEDLDTGADYMNAVRWAASEGIIKGYDAKTFGPDDSVTREQLSVMIYRYAQTLGLGFTGAWYFPLNYADAAEISDWANEAMHWVVMNDILEPEDGKLLPQAAVTSDELDSMTAAFACVPGVAPSEADVAEKIVGSWLAAEINGQPVLTNGKGVLTFSSPTKAYLSAAYNFRPELGTVWIDKAEGDVSLEGNKMTLTWSVGEQTTLVEELYVSSITDTENEGRLFVKQVENGAETIVAEKTIRLVKIDADYSTDILGTWEGRCTSESSAFDDGQDHRWEYKDDGNYVYYVKDGDNWVPSEDKMNEYFVAGNLLCTRWGDGSIDNRESWEISIDGDTMNWTALRGGDDGSTFTVTFEMKKVA